MTKIYEVCYLGNLSAAAGRRFKFKVTQITEINDPSLPGVILDLIDPPYLVFKNFSFKGAEIGDYFTGETDDDTHFSNWKRQLKPSVQLPAEEIFHYEVEQKAAMMERRALTEFRYGKIRLDRILKRVKDTMKDLSPIQRANFALYVYEYLLR